MYFLLNLDLEIFVANTEEIKRIAVVVGVKINMLVR